MSGVWNRRETSLKTEGRSPSAAPLWVYLLSVRNVHCMFPEEIDYETRYNFRALIILDLSNNLMVKIQF